MNDRMQKIWDEGLKTRLKLHEKKLLQEQKIKHRQDEQKLGLEHARELAAIQAGSKTAIAGSAPLVWTGTVREFGDWILAAHDEGKGKLRASSPTNALEQACQHFVREDGRKFKAHSVWQSLQNRKEFSK